VQVGTILNNSIGCGCNTFYQVVASSPKSVTVRRIESKAINVNVKAQTCDLVPVRDKFSSDHRPMRLGVKLDRHGELQIGPIKRMIWWSRWDGKPCNQWSP
jgi:hypothetical protein